MGCCKNVQSPEEDNILSFFNKKLKENNFNFTIKQYKDNYDMISKFSGNNFKRLCKKQNVRLNFIKLLRKEENILIKNNKQKEYPNKIFYHIIILTILLDHKMEEFPKDVIIIENINNDISQYNLISLKRELLEIGYYLFNIDYNDINNKTIIYYLSKLFRLCFKNFNDANNYISIKTYIEKINSIINQNNFFDEEEQYLFVKDNLLTLGEFFNGNNYLTFDEEIPEIIIQLIVIVLNHWHDYLIDNIQSIKENINKNIRNATDKLINYEEENNAKENKVNDNDIKIRQFNNDNINDEIIHKDIKSIFESLYFIFKKIIQDIFSGKNIIIDLGSKLISKNNDKFKFNRIIIFMIFYECYIKDDEKLVLCFMDYITELFINNEKIVLNDNDNIYYDIALNSYYLIYKNEQLSKQYISLLTQIFIKEMEIGNNNIQLLISQLIQIYQKKEKKNKINKLFFYFILNISRYYNNIITSKNDNDIKTENKNNDGYNERVIKNILSNLNIIIKTYFINNNNGFSSSIKEKGGGILNSNNNYNSSTNYITYSIFNEDNLPNNFKISIINYDIITTNFFNYNNIKDELIENIEFYISFHFFIINNMNIFPLINDFTKRERIYNNLFKIVTRLEILLIKEPFQENNIINTEIDENNEYMNYINIIISSLQIALKINELNDPKKYIQDCYLFYKYIARNIKTLLEIENLEKTEIFFIESFNLIIIYSIIFFVLCQFVTLINIPNSITKENIDIINSILRLNEKCGIALSKININNFFIYNYSNENQNYNYLKELFSKEKKEKFNINHIIFKKILEIIYEKLFDKNASLNIFFDNQILNSNYFINVNNSFSKNMSKLSDNITEIKDNSFLNQCKDNSNENFIEDISIQILEGKKKSIDNTNNNIFTRMESGAKIPSENENIVSSERLISKSYIFEDNQYKNIKV